MIHSKTFICIFAIKLHHSRSSVFRILNRHGMELNRGKHCGPIKKWEERKNPRSKGKAETEINESSK